MPDYHPDTGMLVSVRRRRDSADAQLLLYADGQIVERTVRHEPSAYSREPVQALRAKLGRNAAYRDVERIEEAQVIDTMNDAAVTASRIYLRSPNGLRSLAEGEEDIYDADLRQEAACLYDLNLDVGLHYRLSDMERVSLPIDDDMRLAARELLLVDIDRYGSRSPDRKRYQAMVARWAEAFNQPIPRLRRASFDIEVEGDGETVPDAQAADRRITAFALCDTHGREVIYLLGDEGEETRADRSLEAKIVRFSSERAMLERAIEAVDSYPVIVSYCGDDFDLPYLYNRATRLGAELGGRMERDGSRIATRAVHIDLYNVYRNRALQLYAFSNRYARHGLDEVATAMLGRGKIKHEGFATLRGSALAKYCLRDADLTLALSAADDDFVMRMLVLIARMCNLPIDLVSRSTVSTWMLSALHCAHRREGRLIPLRRELDERAAGTVNAGAAPGKRYRGALVMEPKPGIHFGVAVMDFASLYPSIVGVRNLSYETVRCVHPECRANAVPETKHWVCSKKAGTVALHIGSLRDIRVRYYKPLAAGERVGQRQRRYAASIGRTLKVILNASYGALGSDFFPLYFLPLADSTTAYGRQAMGAAIEMCQKAGVEVLYGDTDSLFVSMSDLDAMGNIADALRDGEGIDLELDNEYRYVILSERKKNYVGVTQGGAVHVKGLAGKKSNAPRFVRRAFGEVIDVLKDIEDEADFARARDAVRDILGRAATDVGERRLDVGEYAFEVALQREIREYRTVPQHVKAAMRMERPARRGDIVRYVKTPGGAVPLEKAGSGQIDTAKYAEFLRSTFSPLTDALGIEWDEVVGAGRQMRIAEFLQA